MIATIAEKSSMIATIAAITEKKVQRSYGNHSPCDRSENDRRDRTFTFSVTVVAAIAAMATITGEGRVADFSAGVQGLDIVPGHWHWCEFCRG